MGSFEELGLSRRALEAVGELGYDAPTPVQERAIPLVLQGRDIIATAKTGTGKTAAFGLPLLDGLGHAGRGGGPLALVVTPTRELAMQIDGVCRTIARHTGHRVACLVGGVPYEPQVEELQRGCDLLISTPGRLLDLIGQGNADIGGVGVLVLDEADRMLDMGFLPDVRRIVAHCPGRRQTMLFSATVDEGVQKNMAHLLKEPVYVEVDRRGDTADLVDQYRVDVDHRSKQALLHALLAQRGASRVIVFARTRYRVDACVRKLRREGFSAMPIHSDRTQNQRRRAIEEFASGEADVLVATDVLARGIDIERVSYVVNFDMPSQPEDYVHRVGRTGRAGERGFAVSFVTPDDVQVLRDVQKLIGHELAYLRIDWDGAGQSEQAMAARANRSAARKDPEIAEALREQKARAKRAPGGAGSPKARAAKGKAPARGRKTAKERPAAQRGQGSGPDARGKRGKADGGSRGREKGAHGTRGAAPHDGFQGDYRPGRSQRRDVHGHR